MDGTQPTPATGLPAGNAPAVNSWNAEYIDQLYQTWLEDPQSLDADWQAFFKGFDLGCRLADASDAGAKGATGAATGGALEAGGNKQSRVSSMTNRYRSLGHRAADLDPLGLRQPAIEDLRLQKFSFGEADLDTLFDPGTLPLPRPAPLRDILELLRDTYCRTVGVEYMHVQDPEKRNWLQQRMEADRNRPDYTAEQKLSILHSLVEADGFETFLDRRYKGKKRFGLEGAETLIPILREIVNHGPNLGVTEYIIGMAHRGRINVLVNILQKTYDQIFTEFEEAWTDDFLEGGGDVKYHRGFSSDYITPAGARVHLSLAANPSHLEFGHSVVLGRVRAEQRLLGDTDRKSVVPLLIHGDAAFPGQGIVAECFNMMNLDGYTIGGAIHLIINNQVGFTTNPSDLFSGRYCTDIAKVVDSPIFHINSNDPEAAVHIARLALEFREKFKCDIVLDLWSYRKYGHNEGDEPAFTQPQLYERIRNHMPILNRYAAQLQEQGVLSQPQFDELYQHVHNEMDQAQTRAKSAPVDPIVDPFRLQWVGLTEKYSEAPVNTTASMDELRAVARALGNVPAGFNLHKKLEKILEYRGHCIDQNKPLDWSIGELFAYGTLLLENHAVRLTGQDVERGTFSHRHAVVFDQTTGEPYLALNHLGAVQSRFCVHNSPLTESACVGFEYGYSLADPKMLILWEAQFGDFCNGAQVIIDQFLASAQAKWQRHSGLTLLLPHGYEGAGPEHSSARLERFLQLCADYNMEVAYPTTPAQMFHLLRRQMKRNFRKPLIVMTPKSLLRNPNCVSAVQDLTHGTFQWVLDDASIADPARVTQINFCSGKVYYDMVEYRESIGRNDVALIRIEQLYPFPEAELERILARYPDNARLVYVQEEPRNMGAFRHVNISFRERMDINVEYVGRDPKASPAVASEKMHKQEQHKIMVAAIGLPHGDASPSNATAARQVQASAKPSDKSAQSAGSAPPRAKPQDPREQLQPAHKK